MRSTPRRTRQARTPTPRFAKHTLNHLTERVGHGAEPKPKSPPTTSIAHGTQTHVAGACHGRGEARRGASATSLGRSCRRFGRGIEPCECPCPVQGEATTISLKKIGESRRRRSARRAVDRAPQVLAITHVSVFIVHASQSERRTSRRSARRAVDRAPQVLAITHVSVFIVHASQSERRTSPRRLLVPLDGSLRTESVLPTAARIANAYGAELLLVHVVQEPLPSLVLRAPEDLSLAHTLATSLELSANRYLQALREPAPRDRLRWIDRRYGGQKTSLSCQPDAPQVHSVPQQSGLQTSPTAEHASPGCFGTTHSARGAGRHSVFSASWDRVECHCMVARRRTRSRPGTRTRNRATAGLQLRRQLQGTGRSTARKPLPTHAAVDSSTAPP